MSACLKGTIYSFRNPEIVGENSRKVGFTKRHVSERLKEANSETYSPPRWEVELAKEVNYATDAEKNVHTLLTTLGMRMYPEYPRKEFFNVPYNVLKGIFDLVDGTYYGVSDTLPSAVHTTAQIPMDIIAFTPPPSEGEGEGEGEGDDAAVVSKGKKDMREYFTPDTQIVHRLFNGDEWTGVFNSELNTIVRGENVYSSPSAFAYAHCVAVLGDDIPHNRSGWSECFALINGALIRLNKLPKL